MARRISVLAEQAGRARGARRLPRAAPLYEENAPKEVSWSWPRFPRSGYRLDHLFTTREVERCEYLHAVRTAKLSDHSALEADLS